MDFDRKIWRLWEESRDSMKAADRPGIGGAIGALARGQLGEFLVSRARESTFMEARNRRTAGMPLGDLRDFARSAIRDIEALMAAKPAQTTQVDRAAYRTDCHARQVAWTEVIKLCNEETGPAPSAPPAMVGWRPPAGAFAAWGRRETEASAGPVVRTASGLCHEVKPGDIVTIRGIPTGDADTIFRFRVEFAEDRDSQTVAFARLEQVGREFRPRMARPPTFTTPVGAFAGDRMTNGLPTDAAGRRESMDRMAAESEERREYMARQKEGHESEERMRFAAPPGAWPGDEKVSNIRVTNDLKFPIGEYVTYRGEPYTVVAADFAPYRDDVLNGDSIISLVPRAGPPIREIAERDAHILWPEGPFDPGKPFAILVPDTDEFTYRGIVKFRDRLYRIIGMEQYQGSGKDILRLDPLPPERIVKD